MRTPETGHNRTGLATASADAIWRTIWLIRVLVSRARCIRSASVPPGI